MTKRQPHNTPDLTKKAFARTNSQTIQHRVDILRDMMPTVSTIGEICCGDCLAQYPCPERVSHPFGTFMLDPKFYQCA